MLHCRGVFGAVYKGVVTDAGGDSPAVLAAPGEEVAVKQALPYSPDPPLPYSRTPLPRIPLPHPSLGRIPPRAFSSCQFVPLGQ